MSESWIKWDKSLCDDPRVLRLASRMQRDMVAIPDSVYVLMVLGALAKLWCFADTHIGQDDRIACTPDDINKVVGLAQFAQLLPADWLKVIDSENVHLPDFLEHNGTTAKQRAVNAKRQKRHRDGVTIPSRMMRDNVSRNGHALSVTKALPDKSREEEILKKSPQTPLTLHDSLPRDNWAEWLAHRRAKRWPCDDVTLAKQLKILSALSPAEQTATLERSIQAGWQGLFPEKAKPNGHLTTPPTPAGSAPEVARTSMAWLELIDAAKNCDFREPYRLESEAAYADELRRFRNRSAPKIDTSAILGKLRAP